MKLLIDTVNEDLFLSIIENNRTLAFIHLEKYKHKSEILPSIYSKLLKKLNISTKNIQEIYVVNGPGSFMGIRAGLVFSKTLALVTNIKLYSLDNLSFISMGKEGKYYIDAKGGKSYIGTLENQKMKIEIGEFKQNSFINYKNLIDNPEIYLQKFKKVKNILKFKENYIKKPQIGGN
jgi:tRNA threonylcarbamoyl adenosine modification protein YeaZ